MAMMKTYLPYFIMIIILISVLFVGVYTDSIERIFNIKKNSFESNIPISFICCLFLIPLVKIYMKEPIKKDSTFF